MPLTVADLEAEMIVMLGPYLAVSGLDATTADGTNVPVGIAIRRAYRALGLTPAAPGTVTDEDLEDIPAGDELKFAYLVEYFMLDVIGGNYIKVDQQMGSESQSLSQRRDWIEKRKKELADLLGPIVDPINAPGASSHGLIRAGLCYQARPVSARSSCWGGPYSW